MPVQRTRSIDKQSRPNLMGRLLVRDLPSTLRPGRIAWRRKKHSLDGMPVCPACFALFTVGHVVLDAPSKEVKKKLLMRSQKEAS